MKLPELIPSMKVTLDNSVLTGHGLSGKDVLPTPGMMIKILAFFLDLEKIVEH